LIAGEDERLHTNTQTLKFRAIVVVKIIINIIIIIIIFRGAVTV